MNAEVIAALVDFLRENEPNVLSETGRYMRSMDGRPVVLDVVLAREALDRLREEPHD